MMVRRGHVLAAGLCLLVVAVPARAESIETLRRELRELLDRAHALERRIDALETGSVTATSAAGAPVDAAGDADLDAALAAARAARSGTPTEPMPVAPQSPLIARPVGGAQLKLIDISLDALVAVGGSTERDAGIGMLQAGAHDPKRRGFTLQQAEISLVGAVDPYFNAEAHVVATDEDIELEEAFFQTTSLPAGLQFEGGYSFTEFGRINPVHPHAWDWLDQPVIASRLFGGEGLRNPGVRVGWLVPVPWYAQVHVGAQNASGDTARSFFGSGGDAASDVASVGGFGGTHDELRGVGDLLYLTRLETGGDLGRGVSGLVGGSGLFGPNATGGRTSVWGGDVTLKWRPTTNFRGWPFLVWQSEVMGRRYEVSGPTRAGDTRLDDWGLYSQALVGFRYGWAAGLRYEFAGGSGASVGGRSSDPARADRHRIAPLLVWHPSEFSRIRLQYDYDDTSALARGRAHSVWLGIEVLYGAHPAHGY